MSCPVQVKPIPETIATCPSMPIELLLENTSLMLLYQRRNGVQVIEPYEKVILLPEQRSFLITIGEVL